MANELSHEDSIEIGMLAAELSRSVTYMDQEPDAVKSIAKTLMDWAHADEQGRREIYSAWRNA